MSEPKRTLSEVVEELCPGVVARTRANMLRSEPGSCMHGLLNCTNPSCRPSTPANSGLAGFREIEHWRNGMRVRIMDHQGFDDMNGRTGTVVRICRSNGCAWIECDEDLPDNRRAFPADDTRRNHTRVYKDECEEVRHG